MKLKKIYLAISYSGMVESSYKQANKASVLILNKGLNVFSPITHSHPLTLIDGYTIPHTWEYWQHIDYQFIDWCDEVWVLVPKEGMEFIKKSTGVQAEIKYAKEHNKPVRFVTVINNELKDYEEESTPIQRRKIKMGISTLAINQPSS